MDVFTQETDEVYLFEVLCFRSSPAFLSQDHLGISFNDLPFNSYRIIIYTLNFSLQPESCLKHTTNNSLLATWSAGLCKGFYFSWIKEETFVSNNALPHSETESLL